MPNPMSSVNLSILSFALSSWLDGSAQLRRSLILFPLELGHVRHDDDSPPNSSQAEADSPETGLIGRCLQWLTRPAKDLDEVEKAVLGALDISSSMLLLRLLGSGPILPFILNPLSITLALPRKLSIGPVKWRQVILMCVLLSTLHEAQRTSVAAGLTWLRLKRAASKGANVDEVVIRGQKLAMRRQEDSDTEEEAECVICSGVGYDAPLSDSISSVTSLSAASVPSLGPLEGFCVNVPAKHPMHRGCFVAWKNAYWEERARHTRPVITLVSEDAAVPLPGTWQWRRAQAILTALGITQNAYFVPVAPAQLQAERRDGSVVGESVFTLRCVPVRTGQAQMSSTDSMLGSMISAYAVENVGRLDEILEATRDWSDNTGKDRDASAVCSFPGFYDVHQKVSYTAYTCFTPRSVNSIVFISW
ncbi:hypothetical protein DFH11DRAFT_1507978 [Phellopilus nigrolimitatus]|nr:hypothetical protein DFH11DRAFT_1507978 [Phellopilus nigrolimitatus]